MQRLSPNDKWLEISLLITGNTEIQRLNLQFLGHDTVTDVLSFRYDPLPGEPPLLTGEVIVNAELAYEEGRSRMPQSSQHSPWSPAHEMALYIAHGCDHLTGATDATHTDRARMRRRETGWLRQAYSQHIFAEDLLT